MTDEKAAEVKIMIRMIMIRMIMIRMIMIMIRISQVPQPTCYWKWVGFTIPLKQDNFTLRASRAFNMAHTLYGEQFFS